jgi:hypothetical protein
MILHIYAKIKALNWKPDAESVIQLEADLRPSEVQQIAAFGSQELVVQLLKQQSDMFDYAGMTDQPGLFDQVPAETPTEEPAKSGAAFCTARAAHVIHYASADQEGRLFACDEHLEAMMALAREFGEAVSSESALTDEWERRGEFTCNWTEKPKEEAKPVGPSLCGQPAAFVATLFFEGESATKALCVDHMEEWDPEGRAKVDNTPDVATCEWELSAAVDDSTCRCGHAPGDHAIHDATHNVVDMDSFDHRGECTVEGCECGMYLTPRPEMAAAASEEPVS